MTNPTHMAVYFQHQMANRTINIAGVMCGDHGKGHTWREDEVTCPSCLELMKEGGHALDS